MSLGLLACGGSDDEAARTFTVGGSVSGLSGSGLVLQNNGGDDLAVPAGAAAFVFSTALLADQPFDVNVKTQPAGQSCAVAQGQGKVEADVRDVQVTCASVAAGGGSGSGSDAGDGGASGDGGADGDGGGDGEVRTGAARDCFNPALMTPGTRYRWHMQTQVEGQLVSMVQDRQIEGGGGFAGASDLLVDRGSMTVTMGTAGTMNQTSAWHYQVRHTDAGPVIVDYGGTANSTTAVAGMSFESQHEFVNTPPAEKREFTLQPGQGYPFSATTRNTTTMTMPGIPASTVVDTSTDAFQVTYMGQKPVTVAAGTYLACHFANATAEGSMDVYTAVGSGLPLVMAAVVDGQATRMEMQADSHVNGVPVSQYHAARQ
ncbi:MAG TPA: hypothetical protein PKZ76_15400 [Xanthomonadaceae bacterium]|nr:hypothetical protein [Xanthomonadaceae bacterium]